MVRLLSLVPCLSLVTVCWSFDPYFVHCIFHQFLLGSPFLVLSVPLLRTLVYIAHPSIGNIHPFSVPDNDYPTQMCGVLLLWSTK